MTVDGPEHLSLAVLRPVRSHAFEACVEQLATAIRLGVYPRGTTLPSERDLSERLGVSRATLREAIAALRTAGFVETTRGRGGGTVVTMRPKSPSARRVARVDTQQKSDWHDSLDFRRIVEPGAAALAATRPHPDRQFEQLRKAHAAVANAHTRAAHRQADSRFHLTIAALTGSARVVEAVTAVQASLHEMLLAIPMLETNISHSDAQHRRVLDAILAGQPAKARQAMEDHCDDTAALLRGLIG